MKRLSAIINFIDKNDVVADIGCDHGYLLKLAIENRSINKGYAIDNKIGPLNSAKHNLQRYENITFVLSDGLKSVEAVDINCVVIAGMGGMLINDIISESLEKFNKINKLILCPNRNIDKVRLFLNENGFMIVDEDIVYEDSKFYEILVAKIGNQTLNETELYFGPYLLKNKNETFINKWSEYYEKIKNIDNKKEELKIIEEVIKK